MRRACLFIGILFASALSVAAEEPKERKVRECKDDCACWSERAKMAQEVCGLDTQTCNKACADNLADLQKAWESRNASCDSTWRTCSQGCNESPVPQLCTETCWADTEKCLKNNGKKPSSCNTSAESVESVCGQKRMSCKDSTNMQARAAAACDKVK